MKFREKFEQGAPYNLVWPNSFKTNFNFVIGHAMLTKLIGVVNKTLKADMQFVTDARISSV